MTTGPLLVDDFAAFLELAARENWVVEPWEFEFLLSNFSRGCLVARSGDGALAGLVTSFKHERSGWIGNLIVSAEQRGRGVGEGLFVSALEALWKAGVETVWLTASKSGLALYQKHGFSGVDTIIRWVGGGRQRHALHGPRASGAAPVSSVSGLDCQAWGDRRDALLMATVARGELLLEESGFLVLQPCGDALQIGPFSALGDKAANDLLNAALRMIPFGTKFYLDAPASNRSALRLFNRKKMRISGSNQLMYAGRKPDYRPELLYGLATMGSSG